MAERPKHITPKAATKNVAMPTSRDEHVSMNVRKISNGFVVSHSHEGPHGYKHTETFHPTKPKIEVKAAPKLHPPHKGRR